MPYGVGKRASCPASEPWAVYKIATPGSPEKVVNGGCHATRDEALAQQRALYAKETSAATGEDQAMPEQFIVPLDQKAVTTDGAGEISGLASFYGNVDLQGDIVERGAADKSIARHQQRGRTPIPLLDWHGESLSRLIGSVKELRSVPDGVWFSAAFSKTPEAQRARTLAQEGHLGGVSIGYLPVKSSYRQVDGKSVRVLNEIRLLEISLTPVPANPLAQVAAVKAATTPYGDVPYADPGYKEDGVKRYPLDSEAHCRAAWSYFHMPKNQAGYTAEQVSAIMGRIRSALKRYGVQTSEAASVDLRDALAAVLEIPLLAARKAAAAVVLDEYLPGPEDEDEAPGPADEPDSDAEPAPEEGAAGTDPSDYAMRFLAHPEPRDDGLAPLSALETARATADLDRVEAEITHALESQP